MPSWESYIRKLLLEAQEGICPICLKTLALNSSVIEHNHETGEVRGLIHKSCNNMITQIERKSKKFNYIMSWQTEERIKNYLSHHFSLIVADVKIGGASQ